MTIKSWTTLSDEDAYIPSSVDNTNLLIIDGNNLG